MWTLGAELGDAAAAWLLARLHWEKRADLVSAYTWFRIAESHGHPETPPLSTLAEAIQPALAAKAEAPEPYRKCVETV